MADEVEELTCYTVWGTDENPMRPERVDVLVTRGLTSGKVLIALRTSRKVKDAPVE